MMAMIGSIIVLVVSPLLLLPECYCLQRTGRGLWDQLPAHASNQYYSDNIHRRADIKKKTEVVPNIQTNEEMFNRKHVLEGDNGFWGQMVKNGQKGPNTGKIQSKQTRNKPVEDIVSRHSHNTKNIQREMKNPVSRIKALMRRVNEAKKTDQYNKHQKTEIKQTRNKATSQSRTAKPQTLRTIHALHGDQIDSIEEYNDDYDYIYYDDSQDYQQNRHHGNVPASKPQKQLTQETENAALRAHR